MDLTGKKILITAGPTYEPLDPVRFIGNYSSGKMGIAIADSAAQNGAEVHLVCGPTHLRPDNKNVLVTTVQTAHEMYDACEKLFTGMDVAIFAAAVADYKPEQVADQKIKKAGSELMLRLVKNIDIALELSKIKAHQKTIGFALETENETVHAKEKLTRKKFDAIVLNSLNKDNNVFGADQNKITIIDRDNTTSFETKSKKEVADDIISYLSKLLNKK